ncbi:MAG: LytR C-terminal domain-containing protein [Candidatus Marinimicrobia bacterium]|nr:LytR C-terminal domain-containing protein [Candidatus Neomarinimicrobiota bacterium]
MPHKKKNKLFPFSPAKRKKKKSGNGDTLLNSAIAVLSLVLVAFIISFSNRYTRGGLEIDSASLNNQTQPMLATQYYELNPIQDIEIEILNGCGETGLAAKLSDFLRSHQIDVVRSGNADHFEYPSTIIIQRNEKVENVRKVAAAFNIDITDENKVLVVPDENLDVDITLIVGKDYSSIKPVAEFLKSRY